jgi:asparagine synthase (glutamine-hydrolysing)
MSAIFGVVGAVSPADLKAMGERLAHRGAVASCEEVAPGVHLGLVEREPRSIVSQNGLAAVIDLSPALDRDAAEGELADALAGGDASRLQQLPFAFALAAWDDRSKSLLLARDFVGQKPLHFCALPGGGMAFATEYKALLALGRLPAEPDLDALQYLQCYKTTPPGRTLLRRIATVTPGAVTRVDADGTLLAEDRMQPLEVDVRRETEQAVRDELARRYVDAVRPLVADLSCVGIALSGGIDSLSIAFATGRCAPQAELVGYTAGYGPDDPEIRIAARAMELLGGRHEPVIVTSDLVDELLPEAVWYFESPVGRTETVQMLEIGRAARRAGFDRLMSGMGSDALFAGMPKHKVLWLSQLLPPLRKDLHEFYGLTQCGLKPRRPLAKLMDLAYFRGALPPVPSVCGASWVPELPVLPEAGPEFLNHALAMNAHENLSRSLVRVERPLQAFGIDFASPFFDRALMEFAFSIPSRLKIRRGTEKYILRQAMRAIVSPELLNVPKGISRIRQDRAFADALETLAERYLDDGQVDGRGWFRIEDVRRIRRSLRRRSYHAEAAMRLWTVIVTELWGRIYLDNRGEKPV